MKKGSLRIGACSWNYPSWVGLVYATPQRTAAEYLPEYAARFTTAEVDSWFYRIPSKAEVRRYADAAGPDLRFTCKAPQSLTLTHLRVKQGAGELLPNPEFLSIELLTRFLDTIEPLLDRIDAVMFEFEYLNKTKMASLELFLEKIRGFIQAAPKNVPYALEPRNANYLKPAYFTALNELNLAHVFSEKQYMPHVWELYRSFKPAIQSKSILRLLGGDRKEIEDTTHGAWNMIVAPKDDDLRKISAMIIEMLAYNTEVTVNINNHFEGSAPLTVEKLKALVG
jgi:uncharacterized protein YecE (DUF72 family)